MYCIKYYNVVLTCIPPGLCLLDCTPSLESLPTRGLQHGLRLRRQRGKPPVVRPAAAAVPVHLVPCLRFRSLPAPCLGVPGLLQHVRAGRPYPRQLHAAPRCAHVLRFCKLRHHPQSIRLPRQEYPGPRSYDAMLRGGEYATRHSLSVPYSARPRRMGSRYEARHRQQQPP